MALKFLTNSGHASYDSSASAISASADTDWSMCCWVRLNSGSGTNRVIAGVWTDNNGSPAGGIDFRATTGNNWAVSKYGDTSYTYTATAIDEWRFLSYCTLSGFDGNAYHGTVAPLTSVTAPVNVIGSAIDWIILGRFPGGGAEIRGEIAHLRIWSGYKMTQANFEAEMVSATAVRATNLHTAWECDGNLNDSSGNGHNGMLNGELNTDYAWTAGPISSSSQARRTMAFMQMLRQAG